jgi:site-specific recombinase XerD
MASRSRIFLHRSKTEKLHQGISVSVPHNSRTTSAHRALVELFLEPAPNRVLTLTSDPLFPDSGNRPILRAFLIKRLRAAIARVGRNPAHYAGHSLRKGGAQSLFDAGVDMRDIACVGRWVQGSNAVRLYRSVSATAQARWVEHAASLPPTGRSRQLALSELRQEATAAAQKGDSRTRCGALFLRQ